MDIQFGFLPQTFFLVLARVGGVLATVPFFGGSSVAPTIRAALILAVALVLTPVAPPGWVAAAGALRTLEGIVFGALGEVVLGAAIGLVCGLFVSVFLVGGEIIAQGSGLMMAQEVDPTSGISQTMMSQMLQSAFVLCVVLTNGHLVLLKLVAGSFYSVPPQTAWLTQNWMFGLMALGSGLFEWGVRLAAPVIATILILDVGFGLIARIAPDFDILFMSIPIRLSAALAMFGFVARFGAPFFGSVSDRMLEACAAMLR